MDETLFGWIFLICMLVWRGISRSNCIQKVLHCFGCCGRCTPFFVLQWYVLTWIGLFLGLVRTLYDIVKYDYIGFQFLREDKIRAKISSICEGQEWAVGGKQCTTLRQELLIPPWLHFISLAAPVFGLVGFVILTARLYTFVTLNVHAKNREEALNESDMQSDDLPWKLAPRLEWVVIILGTPLIFIVMSMRSLIRIWTVMTGSAYHSGINWEDIVRLELATYQMDLELSVAFQFYACLMFGLLCTSFMQFSTTIQIEDRDLRTRYLRIVAYTAVQGVYAFVFIGVLRTMFDIAVTYISEMPEYHDKAEIIQDKVLSKVGTIFSFVTILCMVNMVLISKVPDIENGLSNANLKFTGVRLLLLITQIQPQVLQGITVGSSLYQTVSENAEKFHLKEYLLRWTFTPKQALLAHAALLNYECMIVALLTYYLWRLETKQKQELMKELNSGRAAQARERESAHGYWLLDA
mmetsp:Transcript_58709/g.137468  ORF Transcript_58709/g.137468 Transcript_58709/m.137468 type:complete len:466 (-) Transcript_58709:383-1780(-)